MKTDISIAMTKMKHYLKKQNAITLIVACFCLTILLVMSNTAQTEAASKAISITKAKVTLSCTSYKWDGKAKKPSVKVVYGGKTLKNGTDYYIVGYVNNVKPGTAYVSIGGKGKYTDAVKKTFRINECSYLMKATNETSSDLFSTAIDTFTWSYNSQGVYGVKCTQKCKGIQKLSMLSAVSKKCTDRSHGREEWTTVYKLTLLKQIKYLGDFKIATITTDYQITGGKLLVLRKKWKWDLTSTW